MAFPPQCFVLGAQKAGTTSLVALLGQHPHIVVSDPKEPNFFSFEWQRGLDWYRSCFRAGLDDPEALLIDASTSYSFAVPRSPGGPLIDDVPRRIRQVSPDARFVFIVRDAAERCGSAYWHEVRAGRETKPLRPTIEALAAVFDEVVMGSYYHQQISNFLTFFPLDRFLFLGFDDFTANPVAAAGRVCAFAGVRRPDFPFRPERPRNQGFIYNGAGRMLRAAIGENGVRRLSAWATRVVPPVLHAPLKRLVARPTPELSDADYRWLAARFRADAEQFERLTGVPALTRPLHGGA
jgi:hypothetical protein